MYARPFWVLVCLCHLLDWLHNRWIKSWNWQAGETWVPWRIRPCHYHSFARVARSKFWPQFPHLEAILLLKCTHSKVSERMSSKEPKNIVSKLQIYPMDIIAWYEVKIDIYEFFDHWPERGQLTSRMTAPKMFVFISSFKNVFRNIGWLVLPLMVRKYQKHFTLLSFPQKDKWKSFFSPEGIFVSFLAC